MADKLELSEASVKRLFSENSFSLDRLEQICDLLHLQISDLIHQMEKNTELTEQLTREQEKELVSDIKLLLISRNFRFIPGGPFQNFYARTVQDEFLNSRFSGPGEFRIYVSGMFSRDANAEIIRNIKRLADDAHELREDSEALPLAERFGSSMIMAIRPWEVKVFDEMRRVPNPKKF